MIYPQIFYQTLYFLSEFFHKKFKFFENNIISVKLAQVLGYYLVAQSLLKLHEGGKMWYDNNISILWVSMFHLTIWDNVQSKKSIMSNNTWNMVAPTNSHTMNMSLWKAHTT